MINWVFKKNRLLSVITIITAFYFIPVVAFAFGKDKFKMDAKSSNNEGVVQPITVNGDTVEYLTSSNEVSATGHVSVLDKGVKLTCDKLKVNTSTKDAVAEGNVRLEQGKGVMEGSRMTYNFQTKAGTIEDANFRFNPYFGEAETLKKVNEEEFITRRSILTTCDYDKPHYRIKSRKINFFPGDKVQLRDNTFYFANAPVFYLPQYNHSLKDPMMHVQLMAGKSKLGGPYVLTAWQYDLTEDVHARLYFDERSSLGNAEGFGINYKSQEFGNGDLKYYYTQERDKGKAAKDLGLDVSVPKVFQRYFIRWRHKWDIDKNTNLVSEYYKISDSKMFVINQNYNFLKDYFPREYEKDSKPLSYTSIHHSFNYSSLDFVLQKRTDRWYTELEKLPEVKYSFPSRQIGDTPLYFENATQAANYNQKNTSTLTPANNANTPDLHMNRFDTTNKFSLPMKLMVFRLTPFVMNRETYYDGDKYSSRIAPRTIFYSGSDISTKFYRIFNIKTNALGLDLNGLRHIITPSVGYAYNHSPTIPAANLKQIDSVDSIAVSNVANLELSNKLQTKRGNQSVDLVDFRINTFYTFKPKTGDRRGGNLSDILFNLKVLPYSWMSINSDATFKRTGNDDDSNPNYKHFSTANYDLGFNFAKERTFAVGQRYLRKGTNELTFQLNWRLTPKWMFAVYQRYNRGRDPNVMRGLLEQTYTFTRDLHCWVMDLSYSVKKGIALGDRGDSIFIVFRLKAEPGLHFGFNRNYNQPRPGPQTNPYD